MGGEILKKKNWLLTFSTLIGLISPVVASAMVAEYYCSR